MTVYNTKRRACDARLQVLGRNNSVRRKDIMQLKPVAVRPIHLSVSATDDTAELTMEFLLW